MTGQSVVLTLAFTNTYCQDLVARVVSSISINAGQVFVSFLVIAHYWLFCIIMAIFSEIQVDSVKYYNFPLLHSMALLLLYLLLIST